MGYIARIHLRVGNTIIPPGKPVEGLSDNDYMHLLGINAITSDVIVEDGDADIVNIPPLTPITPEGGDVTDEAARVNEEYKEPEDAAEEDAADEDDEQDVGEDERVMPDGAGSIVDNAPPQEKPAAQAKRARK